MESRLSRSTRTRCPFFYREPKPNKLTLGLGSRNFNSRLTGSFLEHARLMAEERSRPPVENSRLLSPEIDVSAERGRARRDILGTRR
jgi:hypothetical protein